MIKTRQQSLVPWLVLSIFAGCSISDHEPTAQEQLQRISKRLEACDSSQQATRLFYELSEVLPQLKEKPRQLIPRLCQVLGDKDFDFRDGGPQCVIAFGQGVAPDLMALLNDEQIETRRGAMRALDFLSKGAWDPAQANSIAEALKSRLSKESDPKMRALVIRTLSRVTGDYEQELELGLQEPEVNNRMSFAAIDQIHTPRSDKVFQLLTKTIRDPQENVYVRSNSMGSLAFLFGERAIPVILERLDDNGYPAQAAVDRLAGLRQAGAEAVPALLRILGTRPELRIPAVKALGEIRCQQSSEVVERIVGMIVDGRLAHSDVEMPLAKISPANFPAIIEAVVADNGQVRPLLQHVLNAGTHYVRPDEQSAAFVIARAFCDKRPAVRRIVADCHFNNPIDVTDSGELHEALASLSEALRSDGDVKVRAAAAELINLMRGPTLSAMPALLAALEDKEPTVRRAALEAIGDWGARATEALSALQKVKDGDADDFVRQRADFAIMKIHGSYPTMDALRRDEGGN